MLGLHREECRNFLQEAKESGGTILLHCLGGQNRFVLIVAAAMIIVAAAMIMLERTPVLDVVRHIKSKRGIFDQPIFPTAGM
jgi:protein-tyrosine phosphatase